MSVCGGGHSLPHLETTPWWHHCKRPLKTQPQPIFHKQVPLPSRDGGNKPILHSLELWRSHLDRDGSGKENDLKTPSPALLLAVGFCHQAEGLPASYPGLKKPHLFRHFQDKFLFSKGTLKFFCFLLELQDLYHRTRSRDAPCCCPEDTQCIVTSVQPSPSSCGSPVSPVSPRHTTSCY